MSTLNRGDCTAFTPACKCSRSKSFSNSNTTGESTGLPIPVIALYGFGNPSSRKIPCSFPRSVRIPEAAARLGQSHSPGVVAGLPHRGQSPVCTFVVPVLSLDMKNMTMSCGTTLLKSFDLPIVRRKASKEFNAACLGCEYDERNGCSCIRRCSYTSCASRASTVSTLASGSRDPHVLQHVKASTALRHDGHRIC